MKTFLRALGNIFLTILVLVLIVYGWIFIDVKLLLKSQPDLFGYAFYIQKEKDMEPAILSNDVVIVQKDAKYTDGDAILYFDSKDSLYKIHYVASIDDKSVTTKCSDCEVNNAPISKNNVVGKAVRKVSFMGKIVNFFKNKVVLITIAVIGVIFLVLSQYSDYKPKKNAEPTN